MNHRYCILRTIVCFVAFGAHLQGVGAETKSIGQQLADYSRSDTSQQGKDCYDAVYNRVKYVLTKHSKSLPEIHGRASETKPFKVLWITNYDFSNWKNIDATYRACGPAGALVSEGLATLVNHKNIWSGSLKPGAVVQVWDVWVGTKPSGEKVKGVEVFDALHAGKNHEHKLGHSFIFLEYKKDAAGKIVGMTIADQGTQWNNPVTVTEKTFGFWVGANLKD